MSYYRAALAAANSGDMSGSARLARCSLLLKEDAPSATCLLKLLEQQNRIEADTLESLRMLISAGRYRKALRVKLPHTSKSHAIRGLIYARIGRFSNAKSEFALALALDMGNELARLALLCCA
jgi:Flp pilus assembly protein TadD